jgi:hypothetical protein
MDYTAFTLFLVGFFSVYYFKKYSFNLVILHYINNSRTKIALDEFINMLDLMKSNTNENTENNDQILDDDKNDVDESVIVKKDIPYVEKYLEKYNKLDSVELSKEKLESLQNCIVIESTPLGVVIMFYDATRETFKYYSDNTIPYRFLEVVGRKYICTFQCKSLYTDMNNIIKEAEDKIENERLEKERIEDEKEKDKLEKEKEKEKEGEEEKDEYVLVGAAPKKNVFAKFKKYNETPTNVKSVSGGGNGQMQMQPTQTQTPTQNKTIILKDKTNRYTCEGKLANYSIIKKVDRKVVDKNYALTFADYKKIMYDKKNL